MLNVGEIIGERYVVQSRIASGGMGAVYKVQDLRLNNKNWAVKHIIVDEQTTTHLDELSMLAKLSHPNIPNISDYIAPDREGNCFLVMELVNGKTLKEYFEQRNKRIPASKVVTYALQLCGVLEYLHSLAKPIIYRDLKPDNIMIDERDDIKLIDFGIARTYKEEQMTDTVALGTYAFASPEQLENKQTDTRSDLYSLGATLYYLLSGGSYYGHRRNVITTLDCSEELKSIVSSLLEYDVNDRAQTATAVKLAFLQLQFNDNGIQYIEVEDELLHQVNNASNVFDNTLFDAKNHKTIRLGNALEDKTEMLPVQGTAPMALPPQNYKVQATQSTPALIIYLLDVSGSMSKEMGTSRRIDVVQQALMTAIKQMVFRSTKGSRISSRYRLAILTYSDQVQDLLGGVKSIEEIARSGFSPVLEPQTFSDAAEAFQYAEQLLQAEISNMAQCPAPLVCHMTDGAHTGDDPEPIAKRIMEMSVPDGNVLVENIFISDTILDKAIPNVKLWSGIGDNDVLRNEVAEKLRRMSSVIPESYRKIMNEAGYGLQKGALMMLPGMNAELVSLGFQMSAATPVR